MITCILHPGNESILTEIEKDLSALFADCRRSSIRRSISFYDTFDWRLYNEGFRLFTRGKRIHLETVQDPHLNLSAPVKNSPRHVTQIHSESMREILSPIVEVRALLPVLKLMVSGVHLSLLDQQKKTIVHCSIEKPTLAIKDERLDLPASLSLTPVKGYERPFEKVQNWCQSRNLNLIKSDLLTRSLRAVDIKPGEYSPQIRLQLDAAFPVAQASQKILAQLLRNMRINEPGLIDDIDIEFLHDYRVSVRRIRSLFSQLKNSFFPTFAKQAKMDFSEIGRLTNKMRDMDVYLLREDSYKSMLPPDKKKDIHPFFEKLKNERLKEHTKIKKYLSGEKYNQIMQKWIKFSNAPFGTISSERGKTPVYGYAQKIILSRYRKIIKMGAAIGPGTNDDVFHRVRIECKKLRYLLEFFLSLFPKRKMNMLIRHLKKLQDNLGHYNDLSIQQDRLHEYTTRVRAENLRETSIAIGILIGRLYNEYQQVRLEFSKCFAQFSSPAIISLFDEMFSVKPDSK